MAGVNIAIPNLAEDLHTSAKMIAWMPTLYLLSSVMFMLPCGKVADNYGRKRVYAFGLGLNAVASLMCALATSIEWVLFWRFIQGAAGAIPVSASLVASRSHLRRHASLLRRLRPHQALRPQRLAVCSCYRHTREGAQAQVQDDHPLPYPPRLHHPAELVRLRLPHCPERDVHLRLHHQRRR